MHAIFNRVSVVLLASLASLSLVAGCAPNKGGADADQQPITPKLESDDCTVREIQALNYKDEDKRKAALELGAQIPGYGATVKFEDLAERTLQDIRLYTTDDLRNKAAIAANMANCLESRAAAFKLGEPYVSWSKEKQGEFNERSYEQSNLFRMKIKEILDDASNSSKQNGDKSGGKSGGEPGGSGPVVTAPAFPNSEIRLFVAKGDNLRDRNTVIYRYARPPQHSGNFTHLRTIGWNDDIRSFVLYGPPGTTVQLFDSDNFRGGDDAIEATIQPGQTQLRVDRIDSSPVRGVRWIHDPGNDNKGLAGKVTSIRWIVP